MESENYAEVRISCVLRDELKECCDLRNREHVSCQVRIYKSNPRKVCTDVVTEELVAITDRDAKCTEDWKRRVWSCREVSSLIWHWLHLCGLECWYERRTLIVECFRSTDLSSLGQKKIEIFHLNIDKEWWYISKFWFFVVVNLVQLLEIKRKISMYIKIKK